MKSFPKIRKIFPEILATNIIGIQPMNTTKFSTTKHWKIYRKNGKWILQTWHTVDSLFLISQLPEITEREFNTKQEAKNIFVLEKLENEKL